MSTGREDQKFERHRESKPHKWKDSKLLIHLTSDVVAGLGTSLLVAPFVSVIDKAITSNASGRQNMTNTLLVGFSNMVKNPINFLTRPSFLAVFAVFSGTYVTNNAVESVCHHYHTSAVKPKFVLGSAVNVGLNLYKDMLFTKWYATVRPKPLPRASYLLFALRDTLTVSTAFVLPPLVSPYLQEEPFRLSKSAANFVTQLTLPCLVQIVSVPVHLVSLDLYNNPEHTTKDRIKLIRAGYWSTAFGRVLRTIPGFGVGGVVNKWAKHEVNIYLKEKAKEFNNPFSSNMSTI